MIKKVAIFGDSWAYGSWKQLPDREESLSGLTFQQMFADIGIEADNFAIRGGSNLDTIKQIKQLSSDYDLLIVFQTDPLRQCFSQLKDGIIVDDSMTLPAVDNFDDLLEHILKNFYTELEQFNQPILLIGGCTKLCHRYVPEKFKTLPMSWTEMLVPDFEDNYFFYVEPALHLYNYARKKLKWESTLADFAEYEKQILSKNHIWETNDYFSWCHAADPGFKIMFEKITEVLNG